MAATTSLCRHIDRRPPPICSRSPSRPATQRRPLPASYGGEENASKALSDRERDCAVRGNRVFAHCNCDAERRVARGRGRCNRRYPGVETVASALRWCRVRVAPLTHATGPGAPPDRRAGLSFLYLYSVGRGPTPAKRSLNPCAVATSLGPDAIDA